MFQNEQQLIDDKIKAYFAANDIPLAELKWQPIPFSGEWGVSTSFFQTAANEARAGQGKKIPVPQRAQEIAEQVKAAIGNVPGISHIEAVKGYLNLYFATSEYARRVVDEVLTSRADFGRGAAKTERVMVEYAQPNTHHSFHIGHARNTILGEVLARLMEFAGFETIRATYPGDMGLSVMTAVWAYDKFYKGQEPEGIHERGRWQVKIYAEATAQLEPKENETPEEKAQREAYDAERREMLRKWEADDPYVHQMWLLTREWSLEEFRDILRILDVKMDVWFYESEANKLGKEIVDELIAKGLAEDERPTGPVIVKIDEKLGLIKEKYRTMVILRSDGTTLYSTKDLALAKQKFEQYHVDRSIYVVDFRQSLHFQQVFKILELWGFPQAAKCYHLSYGYVTLPEGAMSSRRGRVVLFKDVYDEAVKRALSVESERTGNIPENEREKIAEQIGLGALVYSMLSVDNNKDIVFDINEALSFDGRTGPYIQNAHVRANSILKKAGMESGKVENNSSLSTFQYELTKHEIELIEQISRFPNTVQQAANEYRPLVMAAYAYDLANAFHSFYHAVPVLQSENENMRKARLCLVAAAKQTLANALRLLDIKAPEVM
jgi:arginyl-tRNA synthetase